MEHSHLAPHNVEFIERPEISRIFMAKCPVFFNRMTPYDLKARGIDISGPMSMDTLHHYQRRYMQAYINGVQPFRPEEKLELLTLARRANGLLRAFPSMTSLPWRFCKLGDSIENGYPHTLHDIIFLPHDFFNDNEPCHVKQKNDHKKLKIIVHEKVHVFQRKFPFAAKLLMHKVWNYTVFDFMENYVDARNNPDIDGVIYKNSCNGPGFYMAYLPNTSPSLSNAAIKAVDKDGKTSAISERYEHPYERMAYEISDLIVDQLLIDEYSSPLMRWMIDHM